MDNQISMEGNLKGKIMLFEDDYFLLRFYQAEFSRLGYETKGYDKPSENVIQEILEFQPDFIITDIVMPRMDGIELTKVVKADNRTKQIPVFLFSSCTSSNIVDEVFEVGATDFFFKSDFPPAKMIESIEKWRGGTP